jgi:hypothetical protein
LEAIPRALGGSRHAVESFGSQILATRHHQV